MRKSQLPLWIMLGLSIPVALTSFRFVFLGLDLAFPDMLGHLNQRRLFFILHISAASIALALGPLQFLPKFRAKNLGLHRWLGRIYAVSILVAGGAGLVIALWSEGGIVASTGFGLLAILWVGITGTAVRLAMVRKIADHRRWMIRSFALTFAAVTLRLYLLGFIGAGFSYTEASIYLAWLCWVPNLMAAEWFLRRS